MTLNAVDLALVLGGLLMAYFGWRAGIITTVAAFLGFFGGAFLGARLVAFVLADRDWPVLAEGLATLLGMIVLGMVGQALLGGLGRLVRRTVGVVAPLRWVDSAAGMTVSVLAFLLGAWMLLSVAVTMPEGTASDAVRSSRVWPVLDQVVGGPGSMLVADARALLADLNLPALPFNVETLPPVAEPGAGSIPDAVVQTSRAAVLKVMTGSGRCGLTAMGSAVVVGDEQVVTNAHVIAGSDRIQVRGSGGRTREAVLVAVDRATDVAVLRVPGLHAPAPDWASSAPRGMDVYISGHPQGGQLTVRSARVRGRVTMADEAGRGSRQVLVFAGNVEPGNSGGPLLDRDGTVVGLVFATSSVSSLTGFALRPSEVLPLVRSAQGATQPVGSGECPVASP